MRIDKFMMAKAWMKQDQAPQSEARDTWNMMEAEFNDERKATLMANAESDRIKAMMNEQYGPGTVKYGSEIKQPEIKTPQAVFEFSQRHPAANGGLIDDALDAYNYYLKTRKSRPSKKRYKEIPFTEFFEIYGKENFAEGGRTGFYKGTDPEIIKRIKDYGIQKYNKLNNQQKFEVRAQRTSTTPYNFKFGKNKFDATVTGLTKKGANNLQELLNLINEKDLTPQKWFGKTSKASGNKAKGGLDLLARDVVKYLKGEEVKGINKTIFDTIDIKNLIGDKADIVSKIDGISFRQAAGTAASAISQVEASFDAVKLVNKEFMLDPDISIDELAERLYGKGASNSVRALQDTQADIAKYIDVLKTGTRANVQIPDFKYPSSKKAFEILDSIEDRSSSFGFQEGVIRELKFNVRDNLLNFKKGSTLSLRRMLSEVIADSDFAGNVIDESVGLSASYDKLPGYTEATQILPNELNQRKAAEIDKPFNKLINKVYKGTATPKEIKEYNASARKFMKETKVDVPIIRSTITGDDLKNPSKFIRNLSSFSEEAQKNILELAKNKNIVIETGAKPLALKEGKATMETAKDFFENNKKMIESYITDTTGKVKPPMFSSGFAGAYEMLSDDLKNIVNSEGFKKFANSKTAKGLSTIARTPGKFFGLGDVLLGYLDYTNNKPMMSEAKAYQSMLQAMSFNVYRGGDKQNLKEIKEKFIANGGDGNIFDQVVTLNKQNADILQTVEKTKKNYTKNLENEKASGNIIGNVGLKYQVDLPTASEQLKLDLNSIKSKAENMEKNFNIYKETYTGEDLTKPSKDLKRAAFDLLEEEQIKNYPSTYDQVNTGSGPVAEQIYNSILTKDSYKKLLPQNIPSTVNQLLGLNFKPVTEKEKEAALIQEMKKNAPQELYRYNKEFRGMDPDEPMNIEETANFMNKNKKAIGFAEGGLAGLMKKYYD